LDTLHESRKSKGLALSFGNVPCYAQEEEEEEEEASSSNLQGKTRVRTWKHCCSTNTHPLVHRPSTPATKKKSRKRKHGATGGTTDTTTSGSSGSPLLAHLESELHRHMAYHVHPSGALPGPMLGMKRLLSRRKSSDRKIQTGEVLSSFFTQRINQWREAFISLFTMLKNGGCDHFYYRTMHFTVLFKRHTTVAGEGEDDGEGMDDDDDEEDDDEDASAVHSSVCAVMSPSTKKLRNDLAVHDISYSMPLLPGGVMSEQEMFDRDENVRGNALLWCFLANACSAVLTLLLIGVHCCCCCCCARFVN